MKNNIICNNHVFKKYISNDDIIKKIQSVAIDINNNYSNKNPIFLGVLKGSIYFMMDLLKYINFNYEIDFVKINSYSGMHQNEITYENINFNNFKNRNIIIIEDVIDSGNTINLLFDKIKKYKPESCSVITLLKKENIKYFNQRKINYFCFEIKNKYVIGYGLDINNLFRNLKDIYIKDD